MKPAELAKQCVDAINFWRDKPECASVTLVLPRKWKAPPKFPRRELLCVNADGQRVCSAKALDVLAWLAANGFVNVAKAPS